MPSSDPITPAFERLRDRLLGTAYGILGHREDARDAVQDAYVKCWRARETATGNLEAWIFMVLLNASRDLRRRRTIRRMAPLSVDEAMRPDSQAPDPIELADRRDRVARVRVAIRDLPETEREVFLLRQNAELTFTAIAEVLGAPVGTVKTRMRSALRRLRLVLVPAPAALKGAPR